MLSKTGPYTIDELFSFWQSIVDRGYSQPFVEQLKGLSIDAGADIPVVLANPKGSEVFTQMMAQAKRVSQAVDRNAQAFFIRASSGQSDLPAQGGSHAIVDLTFERTLRLELYLTIPAGFILAEEEQIDWGDTTGVVVKPGRRYMLTAPLHFAPGERGPKSVVAMSEKEGYGYNDSEAGTITALVQPGNKLSNDRATIVPGTPTHRMLCRSEPDVVVPENVGQMIEFISGANTGQVRRMLGYQAADPAVPHGGVAVLARTAVFQMATFFGTFIVGEQVIMPGTNASGTFVYLNGNYIILEAANDSFIVGGVAVGSLSGAAVLLGAVHQSPTLIAEVGTATWRILDWSVDLGLTVTNAASPAGGRTSMLDELGRERGIERAPGELDDRYRKRVHALPDTVSPNAIRRAANRVLSEYGLSGILREVGSAMLPGLFFDGDPADVDPRGAFAFDFDFTVAPEDRYKLLLSFEEMRAFFLMALPQLWLGDYGCAYDSGPSNAYDSAPWLTFYDGFPVTSAVVWGNIWQAIDKARAGGVGFDLVVDPFGSL